MSNPAPVIGLVAHDDRKAALARWCADNVATLSACTIFATGTTGGLLMDSIPQLSITRLKSGPLGGDQQIGAMIAEDRMDALIFFMDPLSPHPHDVDVKALTRMATLKNVLFACNEATADAIVRVLETPLAG